MSDRDRQKIVALQKALKVAKDALTAIAHGASRYEQRAEVALDEIWKIESQARPTPFRGLMESPG